MLEPSRGFCSEAAHQRRIKSAKERESYVSTMDLHTIEACIHGITGSLSEVIYNLHIRQGISFVC